MSELPLKLVATAGPLVAVLLVATPANVAAQCGGGDCHYCDYPETHLVAVPTGDWWPETYECVAAPCPNPCWGFGAAPEQNPDGVLVADVQLEALIIAVSKDDWRAIAGFLGQRNVTLNNDRRAIQVMAVGECARSESRIVAAHIPLSLVQMAVLSRWRSAVLATVVDIVGAVGGDR